MWAVLTPYALSVLFFKHIRFWLGTDLRVECYIIRWLPHSTIIFLGSHSILLRWVFGLLAYFQQRKSIRDNCTKHMNCCKYFAMNEICSQEILGLFSLVGGILGRYVHVVG